MASESILAKVKEEITEFKHKIKPKQIKSVPSDPDIKKHLEELQTIKQFCIYM